MRGHRILGAVNGRCPTVRLLSFAAVAAIALAVAGCGGSSSKAAKDILRRGFATSIGSANISIDITGKLDGIPQLTRPVRVRLAGPYRNNGPKKIPSLSWDVSISGGGQAFSTGLISTGDRAFVNFQGTAYEVSPSSLADLNRRWSQRRSGTTTFGGLGLHPLDWVHNPSKEGDSDIAGVKTTHVSASLDVGKMLADLNHLGGSTATALARTPKLSQRDINEVKKVVKNPRFDVYVGKSDGRIRRIAANVEFSVPPRARSQLRGLKGGNLSFSVEFAAVGEPQTIRAPRSARPISQLRQQLLGAVGGGLGGGLGGGVGGQGGGSAPGGGGASSSKLQRYSQCLEKAKPSDTAALQRCAALLK